MKLVPHLLTVAVLAALSAPAYAEMEFDVIGGSEVSFEGLVQADYDGFSDDVAVLNGSALDGLDSDSQIRRSELILKGKGPGMWNWVLGYDATAKKFLDTNVSYRFGGFTTLWMGQFKQPNSLEELSSTRYNDFVSKSMTTNMQSIARRTGVALSTGGDQWTLTGSAFFRELTRNLAAGNGYGARFTWLPINDTDSGSLLHFGVSMVDYDAEVGAVGSDLQNTAQWRVRPDADLAGKRLIDSGTFTDADQNRTIGLEGMWARGPFKLQSEYMRTTTSRTLHDDYSFDSWYVQGVWNLTGEKFGYKAGVVTTSLPNEPASGMWQLAVRYDTADLNDGSVSFANPSSPVVSGVMGGKEHNWTVGVNWYWRSNFKFALNYVKVDSVRYSSGAKNFVNDDPSIVEFRAQLYW